MWTHVQLAWWWYLELRRDRNVICIMRYEPNVVLGWIVIGLVSIQSIEEDLWIFIGTTTIEKGGGLIAVTGMMQTIAVIVNIFASWTIIVVMYIIVTLENGALDVDCRRMMMIRTMMNSIGEWRVGQTQHGAAKSSLSNTIHHSSAHHHPTAVNNESTIFQADNKMHGNDDNSISNVVDSDSNCLHDTSDSNESFSFLNGTSTHGDSKVFFNGGKGMSSVILGINPIFSWDEL